MEETSFTNLKNNNKTIENTSGEVDNSINIDTLDLSYQLSDSLSETDCPKRKRICCVGMCVLDIIHVCSSYPVEDTDKRCLSGSMQRGGNASNNCTILRELGYSNVEFLGMMSTALGFEFLPIDCQRRGIIYKNCPTVKQNPPFSSVILVENTDSRTIVHSNSNFPILEYQHFACLLPQLDTYSWIHFEARNPKHTLRIQNDIHDYNRRYRNAQNKIIISVEFEKMFVENLVLAAGADFIFLGKDLARHMNWKDPHMAVYGLRDWLEKNDKKSRQLPAIICPWGDAGAGSLDQQNNYNFSASYTPEKIVDALGAGDTFCAAVIYGLAALNWQLKASVDFGNYCAAVKLSQYGYDGLGEKVKEFITKRGI